MYQPQWSNGQESGKARRDAAGRYRAIADHLKGRGFRVLDVGANAGYFSLRLAEEFQARVTAVDGDPILKESLERARNSSVEGIYEFLSPDSLKKLGVFDVGLCLSVLHHVSWWPTMLRLMRAQCRTLFIETAHPKEDLPKAFWHSPEILRIVSDMGGNVIHESPGFDSKYLRPLHVVTT